MYLNDQATDVIAILLCTVYKYIHSSTSYNSGFMQRKVLPADKNCQYIVSKNLSTLDSENYMINW